ncbi:hypothetical protein OSB04_013777 [Centaurea solstitialis]|uniref:indole-3-pyruvate monooxygenase n=1 Tax=Centaurea solstitialis TaxID=347529 RepID=A0AA38TYM4_9ASTR|nr:hypothetical protein OSB04_013777 [Centaurea solstitialis]
MGSCENDQFVVKFDGPIIVGAGPSGIAVAACLQENGVPSLVLERSDCIASLWQHKTYDRLKLHLPKQFCELPLFGYPKNFPKYPSKNQFVSYMEAYADHFGIKPRFGQSVGSAEFDFSKGVWRVNTQDSVYESRWLVVATGENAEAVVPEIVGVEKFEGVVRHTSEYKSGCEFRDQRVLVVGCGNSGWRLVWTFAVTMQVHVLPREMFGFTTFGIAMALLKWLPLRVVDKLILFMANLTLGNTDKLGLRRPKTGPLELKNATGKTPVLDTGALSLIKSGNIKVVEQGVREITKSGAKFMDGQEIAFESIVLATGYKSNVPFWLKGSDFFTDDGMPKTPFPNGWRGENGLYTVGFTRRGLLGTTCDALKIAKDVTDQWRSTICNSKHEFRSK